MSIPALSGNFKQYSDSWYVHNFLTKNFVYKEYLEHGDVHNNVRKWPNLCSIKLWDV